MKKNLTVFVSRICQILLSKKGKKREITGFNFGIGVLYVPSADHDLLSSHVEQQLGIRRDSLLLEQAGVRQIWNNQRRERGVNLEIQPRYRDSLRISRNFIRGCSCPFPLLLVVCRDFHVPRRGGCKEEPFFASGQTSFASWPLRGAESLLLSRIILLFLAFLVTRT